MHHVRFDLIPQSGRDVGDLVLVGYDQRELRPCRTTHSGNKQQRSQGEDGDLFYKR